MQRLHLPCAALSIRVATQGESGATARTEVVAAYLFGGALDILRVVVGAPDDYDVLDATTDKELAAIVEPKVARAEESLVAAATGNGSLELFLALLGALPVTLGL